MIEWIKTITEDGVKYSKSFNSRAIAIYCDPKENIMCEYKRPNNDLIYINCGRSSGYFLSDAYPECWLNQLNFLPWKQRYNKK